ncbi:PREDICTED: uncharacterized protein LOC106810747 [Priapulus caudatus]|uniref:Uncharacterized protein LOC106810747 n=1 Tax=Priapulus caudatus TaxID=37621 RepID=A0ABM1EBV9_PRICU|nr:PREDICTED: uncharacterized protein LOC106810747 [Priapulus caudatus]
MENPVAPVQSGKFYQIPVSSVEDEKSLLKTKRLTSASCLALVALATLLGVGVIIGTNYLYRMNYDQYVNSLTIEHGESTSIPSEYASPDALREEPDVEARCSVLAEALRNRGVAEKADDDIHRRLYDAWLSHCSGNVGVRLPESDTPAANSTSAHDLRLIFKMARRKRAATAGCDMTRVGDGWCDEECNTPSYRYDNGDCCAHICELSESSKLFPCGSNGYNCKIGTQAPAWFRQQTQFCFRWHPDGDGGQCGTGSEPREICANTGQQTAVYRDDTDGRGGGCQMSWGIVSPHSSSWFKAVQVCYRFYADGNAGQCHTGSVTGRVYEFCAPVGQFTSSYRDDTDGRAGGCRMSWKLKLPSTTTLEPWAQKIQLCFQWYPDGDGGQCGGGAARKLCANAGFWTPYYRDDTDGRGGGCRMSWGIYAA